MFIETGHASSIMRHAFAPKESADTADEADSTASTQMKRDSSAMNQRQTSSSIASFSDSDDEDDRQLLMDRLAAHCSQMTGVLPVMPKASTSRLKDPASDDENNESSDAETMSEEWLGIADAVAEYDDGQATTVVFHDAARRNQENGVIYERDSFMVGHHPSALDPAQ